MKKRIMHRSLTTLLILALLLQMLPGASFAAAGSEILAKWSFVSGATATAATLPQTAVSGAFPLSSFSHSTKTDVAYTASNLSVYTNNWNDPNPYWQIDTSSLGYKDLNIAFEAWGSGTSPKDFKVQYSTNGAIFTDISAYVMTDTARKTYNFDLPAAANNAKNLTLRFLPVGTTSIGNGTTATGGNSRMGEVVLTGEVRPTQPGEPDPDDPIPDSTFPADAVTLKAAAALPDSTNATVVGQLVYRYGNYDTMNTAILEDIISGEVVALQVYSNLSSFSIGDVIKVSGQKSTYGGVPQLSATTTERVSAAADVPFIAPKTFFNLADLKAKKDTYLSQVVLLKNVTLGTYSSTASTTITDIAGDTMDIYRAGTYPASVTAGEVVDLLAVLSKYNTTDQLRAGSPAGNGDRAIYTPTTAKPPTIKLPDSQPVGKSGADYTVSAEVTDAVGVKDVVLTYVIGGSSVEKPMVKNDLSGAYEYVIKGQELIAVDDFTFTIKAGNVNGLEATSPSRTVQVQNIPLLSDVTPVNGSATGTDKRPLISAQILNAGANATVKLTLTRDGSTTVLNGVAMTESGLTSGLFSYNNTTDLADGKYKASVEITRQDSAKASYDWSFTVGDYQFAAYFGQLHAHTNYSDGTGTLPQALGYIKDTASKDNVDFVAFTDHSNYFDASSAANPEAALGDLTKATPASAEKWRTYTGDMRDFNAANTDILAVPGFEMTWSSGPGHINTFNTEGIVSRNNTTLNNKASDAGMRAYYELLKKNPDSISQFNHPGTTFGTFANFSYWDPAIDPLISMVEVGNGEGVGVGNGYFPSYEYYIQALDKGWHLAPTNNQDNHKGRWGNSNTMRSVIITDDFSEAGLLQGMRDRSIYATEDKNLAIAYRVNGMNMGTIIKQKPAKVHIQAEISDPDNEAIGKVEVVVNGGRVAHSVTYSGSSAALDVELSPDYSWYFLRVIQPDTDIAVTAPVWVGDTIKSGLVEVTTDTVMPVLGEEMTFQTSLFNFEPSTLQIDKMEYAITHLGTTTVIKTDTAAAPVPSGTNEKLYALKYTPDKLGPNTLTVKVSATQDGVKYDYETSLNFEVLDPDEIIPIAIDAGHSNFYVSGNYAESDANFIEMCNVSGLRVTRLKKDELTYDNIKDMQMLVLTVPFVSFGTTVNQFLYTPDEIAAIKKYAEQGGNLMVCSKSDRGDPAAAAEKAAYISNQILEAVGAKARVGAAIVVDPIRKANEAFRITLGGTDAADKLCFNYAAIGTDPLAAAFLRKVEDTTNNTFSAYNSAPIIPNGATTLVSGFPTTTYSTPFSNITSGNQVNDLTLPPVTGPGDTHLMTAEFLSGGGFLITSGVTFFSTFEVKVALDNIFDLQNSNYQLAQNVIDYIKGQNLVVTDIKDVQAAPEGRKFTVEGLATSNASGYDKATAFFDSIYMQDATAGINLFPVDGNIQAGQTLRVTGYTSSYNGEHQLNVSELTVLDSTVKALPAPKDVTSSEINTGAYLGSLVKLSGTITEVVSKQGLPESIFVKDSAGHIARVFIDGYITPDKEIANLAVGNTIAAIGFSSHGTEGYRIRTRDRADITAAKVSDPDTGNPPGNPDPNTTPGALAPDPKAAQHQITFHANGGGKPSFASKDVAEGAAYGALPTVSRSGYSFSGWYTAKSGGEKITAATLFTGKAKQTLYAHWKAKQYSVTFHVNGGKAIKTARKTVTYAAKVKVLPTVKRTGYLFSGWYTAKSGGKKITANTVWKTARDVKLYAHWKKADTIGKLPKAIYAVAIRTKPGVMEGSRIVGFYHKGDSFKILGKYDRPGTRGDWYMVRYKKKIAWIWAPAVKTGYATE